MTEEKAPEKTPIAQETSGPATLPSRPKESETESSASYIAAGNVSAPPDSTSQATQQRSGTGAGPGLLVLVVLAAVVGALVSLYVVRESPWLAQKILKEQQAQAVDEPADRSGGQPASEGRAEKGDKGDKESSVPDGAAEAVGGLRPSDAQAPVAPTAPRLDPLISQRIAQMQQWSVTLRTLRAGPKDPSAELHSILTAPRLAPASPPVSDKPVKTPPTAFSGSSGAPETTAASPVSPEPPVVDPFGERLGRWFDGALDATGRFLASLVRIQQLDDPDLAGQTLVFFSQVDQRVQSHLLSARLLLMQDQPQLASEELAALIELLTKYYDPAYAQIMVLKEEVSALRLALKGPA